jgi:hypothetical protein
MLRRAAQSGVLPDIAKQERLGDFSQPGGLGCHVLHAA